VLRIVVRAGFSRSMADQLLDDIVRAVEWFEGLTMAMPEPMTHGSLWTQIAPKGPYSCWSGPGPVPRLSPAAARG